MSRVLPDSPSTVDFGAQMARIARPGDVIALRGDLGAGKTTFSRGFIQALIDVTEVPSPTYTLIQTYDTPGFEIWHCDFYRLEAPDDIYELGILDAFEESVVLMEWPDKIGHHVPTDCLNLTFKFQPTGRLAVWDGPASWMERLT